MTRTTDPAAPPYERYLSQQMRDMLQLPGFGDELRRKLASASKAELRDYIEEALDAAASFDTNGLCLLVTASTVFVYEAVGVALPDYRRLRKAGAARGVALIAYVDEDAWTALAADLQARGCTVEDRRG